jgi:hypothetical protein
MGNAVWALRPGSLLLDARLACRRYHNVAQGPDSERPMLRCAYRGEYRWYVSHPTQNIVPLHKKRDSLHRYRAWPESSAL